MIKTYAKPKNDDKGYIFFLIKSKIKKKTQKKIVFSVIFLAVVKTLTFHSATQEIKLITWPALIVQRQPTFLPRNTEFCSMFFPFLVTLDSVRQFCIY